MHVEGLIPPVITPLTQDGEIDAAAVNRITERMVRSGATGLFTLGSSGEGPTLSDAQRERATALYLEASAGRIPVYMGVPDPSAARAATAMATAVRLGAAGVVVGAPYYYAGAQAGHVLRHVRRCLDDWDVRALLYNIPQATGNAFTPDDIAELAADDRVVAIKDSSAVEGDSIALQEAARASGLAFLQGAEALMAASVARGADGIIPGVANIVPALSRRLLDAARAADPAAAQLQLDLVAACDVVYRGGHWLAALKATASELGLCGPTNSAGVPPVERGADSPTRLQLEAISDEPDA